MTIDKKKLEFPQILVMALLLGAVIGETSNFINYYFGKYLSDSIILLTLASGAFLSGALIKKRSNGFYMVITFLMIHLVVGINYAYALYQITEWISSLLYGIIVALALGAGWQSKVTKSNRLFFLIAMLIGFSLVAFGLFPIIVLVLAVICLIICQLLLKGSSRITLYLLVVTPAIAALSFLLEAPVRFDRQSKYYDPLIFSKETSYQTIDITSWKGNEWFYYNNINQFSSIDHWLYFEPMAHVPSQLSETRRKVLIIGGENGLLAHQLLKYPDLESIDLIPIDDQLFHMATEVDHFTRLNQHFSRDERVHLLSTSVFDFLASSSLKYDLIFIDVPDPIDIELNQYYTVEFYQLCYNRLNSNGILTTQAGSPYFATKAFTVIKNSISASGFTTLPIHNQILTLGEWGWVLGLKAISKINVDLRLTTTPFDQVSTTWLNKEAVLMMTAFGKPTIQPDTMVNSLKTPLVHEFYTQGTWKFK